MAHELYYTTKLEKYLSFVILDCFVISSGLLVILNPFVEYLNKKWMKNRDFVQLHNQNSNRNVYVNIRSNVDK